jgi:RimJ/RimL family protein N-acetyltransferase
VSVPPILTERLELVALSPELLEASLARDIPRLSAVLGATVPPDWFDEQRVIRRRLGELRSDPSLAPWLLRAMITRDTRTMVGRIGFHTAPNAPYLTGYAANAVELGYTVFAAQRRRGYARESIRALISWAHQHHQVSTFILSISPSNAPSLALAAHLDFTRIGSHQDEEDGSEDIFALMLP